MPTTETKSPTRITLRLRKGTEECKAFTEAVNQGIDAYLEAVTDSTFKDCGSVLQAELGVKDTAVIVRRLLEKKDTTCDLLVLKLQKQQMVERDCDEFTKAYMLAALWSSDDESDPRGGNPMEDNYSMSDIEQKSWDKIVDDCAKFQEQHAKLLEASGLSVEQAGHDFWLTRNRHGSGFWDRDLPDEIGDALTEAAHAFGETGLYVGDDGQIYGS